MSSAMARNESRAIIGSTSQVRLVTDRMGPAEPSKAPPNWVIDRSISSMPIPET
jgi:hypothetical protein